jgi:fumarate reductase subunit C
MDNFFLMKSCQASVSFVNIGLLTALLHLKVSRNFYTRFTNFMANSDEILVDLHIVPLSSWEFNESISS